MMDLTQYRYRVCMSWTLCLLLIGILPCSAFSAEENMDNLAKTILSSVGVNVGICEMPRVGDGRLAAALALHGVSVVHGLVADQEAATRARQPAITAGVMGSQVTIEVGDGNFLPLSEGLADLYLVVDATDDILNTLSAVEAGRILAPYRGVAMVGNPLGIEGGLSQTKLEAWARETGGTVVVHNENGGLWAVTTMPPLKGGDDWGHFYHGPDLDPVSHDSAFVSEHYQLQAYDFPLRGARNFSIVASAGRYFVANSSLYSGAPMVWQQMPWEIIARSLSSAKVLWRRPLSVRFGDLGSLMVATPDRFFLKDGPDVLVLNPETGEELSRIKVTQEPLNVQWLAVSDGVLLTLAGPRAYNPMTDGGSGGMTALLGYEKASHGEMMRAWDSQTGSPLWKFSAQNIATRKCSVSEVHVLLSLDQDQSQAMALDLHSGQILWETPAPMKVSQTAILQRKFHFNEYRGEPNAVASSDAYVLMDSLRQQYCAFSIKDGKLLWDATNSPDFKKIPLSGFFLDQRLMGRIDTLSGKPSDVTFPQMQNSASCGHYTLLDAREKNLFIGFGVGEMETGRQVVPYVSGSQCGTGFFVANGTEVLYPNTCSCTRGWHGMMLIKPLGKSPPQSGPRSEKGKATKPKDTSSDTSDWTSYRSDESRKGSSDARVQANSRIRWIYEPGRPAKGQGMPIQSWYMQPNVFATQVVCVGERLWFGTAEGSVVCLERSSGKKLWETWTAGSILSTPAWSGGRIFAGSGDGSLYCMDAKTGLLVWRYRVAPEDRRINFMSRLSSSWPVRSLMVRDGTAYASAGILGRLDGSAMCAVDVETGDEIWSHFMTNSGNTYPNGKLHNEAPTGAEGTMAWYGDKLWWLTSDYGPIIIDPQTGDWKQALDPDYFASPAGRFAGMDEVKAGTWLMASGKDLGILPGGWVTFGNPLMFGACDRLTHSFMKSSPEGVKNVEGKSPIMLTMNKKGQSFFGSYYMAREIPVWDNKEVLAYDNTAKGFGPPTLFSDFSGALDRAGAQVFSNKPPAKKPAVSADDLVHTAYLEEPLSRKRIAFPDELLKDMNQRFDKLELYGSMVLASNAVICTNYRKVRTVVDARDGRMPNNGTWKVTGIDRKDCSILFNVVLPSAPAPSGMSLNRAGDVMIPLVDGRVVCLGGGSPVELPEASAIVDESKPGWQMRRYQTDLSFKLQYYSWTESDLAILPAVEEQVLPQLGYNGKPTGGDEIQDIVHFTGTIAVPKSGIYHLFGKCPSGGSARCLIYDKSGQFDQYFWNINGKYAYKEGLPSPNLFLTEGRHPISIIYIPGAKESALELQWDGPEIPRGDIPAEAITH